MNDTGRQLVILIGVMTVVISSVITVSTQYTDTKDSEQPNTSINETSNTTEGLQEDRGLIGQSLNGLSMMLSDINSLLAFIS